MVSLYNKEKESEEQPKLHLDGKSMLESQIRNYN
jgi:hypothetical protein